VLLHEILEFAAAAEPDTTALVVDGSRWSFAELHAEARSFARGIAALIQPGDRVVIVAENRAAFVVALYAVPAAGGVLVFGNTRHTAEELAELVDRSGATVLIGTADHLDRLGAIEMAGIAHRVCLDDRTPGAIGVSDVLAEGEEPADPHPGGAHPEDMAWLLFTSGTTGRAKGAMITHRNLVAAALNTTIGRPIADDEVYLFPFPLFHIAAYNVVHHHLRRRTVVLLPGFDPVDVMKAVGTEGVTSISLAPTMLAMVLDHPERRHHDLSSLRTVSYGAAAMPRNLLHRVLDEWPSVGLAQGYGMTELSGNAVFLSPEDHRRAASIDPELLTAAGRPAPLVALRIAHDDGSDVPAGELGEILVRGDQVCAGYWRDPEATDAAFSDGWLRTGDVGRIDRRGYLHVLDRKKDIVITGGENVSSREVEDAIGGHPEVSAVAVLGVPDDTWGERVVAVVVPEDREDPPTLESLRAHVSHLAGFKHPRELVLVEALPTNASGKVDKPAIRARLG
jgi:acyl-CoA synthetase (AMP-forming)/AMP-acid ligase II